MVSRNFHWWWFTQSVKIGGRFSSAQWTEMTQSSKNNFRPPSLVKQILSKQSFWLLSLGHVVCWFECINDSVSNMEKKVQGWKGTHVIPGARKKICKLSYFLVLWLKFTFAQISHDKLLVIPAKTVKVKPLSVLNWQNLFHCVVLNF